MLYYSIVKLIRNSQINYNQLTNDYLYDVLFGDEEIKDSGDSFFSKINMKFIKKNIA
jgi:hypothetical protein